MQFAVYMAFRLRLETAFLADECASATAAAIATELHLKEAGDAAAAGELPVSSLVGDIAKGEGAIGLHGGAGGMAGAMDRADSAASMIESASRLQLSAPGLKLSTSASSELAELQRGPAPAQGLPGAGTPQKGSVSPRKLVGEAAPPICL